MGKRKQNGLYIVSGVYFVNISLLIINQYGLFLHDQHILDGTVTNTGFSYQQQVIHFYDWSINNFFD